MLPEGQLFEDAAGRVALVTGAASGIGEATVRRLVTAGIRKLVLLDRHEAATRRVVASLPLAEEIAEHIAFLLSDRASSVTGAANVVDGGYSG